MERIDLRSLSQKQVLPKIQHGESIVQLGSCFSTHLTKWFQKAGFNVLDNPLGIIFHPIPLAKQIEYAFSPPEDMACVWKDDVCLSYFASSELYALSEMELRSKMFIALDELKQALMKAKIIFITFGSAHVYRLKENDLLVANCHQQTNTLFQKELSSCDELTETWKKVIALVKTYNPEVEFVFTISPVRYIRDGLLENSKSKSVLFQLVSELQTEAHYFPAFELILDVLRDYCYFEQDGVHPNQLAIDFVWNFLRSEVFSEDSNKLVDEVLNLRKMEEHRLLYPDSIKAKNYLAELQRKRESFLSLHPNIIW